MLIAVLVLWQWMIVDFEDQKIRLPLFLCFPIPMWLSILSCNAARRRLSLRALVYPLERLRYQRLLFVSLLPSRLNCCYLPFSDNIVNLSISNMRVEKVLSELSKVQNKPSITKRRSCPWKASRCEGRDQIECLSCYRIHLVRIPWSLHYMMNDI